MYHPQELYKLQIKSIKGVVIQLIVGAKAPKRYGYKLVMWHYNKTRMMTYKIIISLTILIFLYACGGQVDSKTDILQSDENVSDSKGFLNKTDSLSLVQKDQENKDDNISIWIYDCMADTIIQMRKINRDTLTFSKLISTINAKYRDKVKLDYLRISNDTIYVKIDKSEYLTQQMGTAGADEYMIAATFTLTELQNIKYVNFDFEFGDHASPGTYNRMYYLDRIRETKEMNKK
jgi:hypothetical protein